MRDGLLDLAVRSALDGGTGAAYGRVIKPQAGLWIGLVEPYSDPTGRIKCRYRPTG
jgi:hypothetical protein